jgi:hypothetical protein
VHNSKAFLEGLIVNEVLTKTASFEKLAFPPFAVPLASRAMPPDLHAVPPIVHAMPPALQIAYYAWQKWRESQKRSPVNEGANLRQPGLDAHPQPPTGVGNNVGRGVPKGKPPSKEEAIELMKSLLNKP